MNITELNKAIAALNQIAEIATSAAGVLEQAGWESFEDHHGMSGVRPIAATPSFPTPPSRTPTRTTSNRYHLIRS